LKKLLLAEEDLWGNDFEDFARALCVSPGELLMHFWPLHLNLIGVYIISSDKFSFKLLQTKTRDLIVTFENCSIKFHSFIK